MEHKEAKELIDSMELSPDKKSWMQQYAQYHIENEKNPPQEVKKDEPKREFVHFEIHPIMKEMWKQKINV